MLYVLQVSLQIRYKLNVGLCDYVNKRTSTGVLSLHKKSE